VGGSFPGDTTYYSAHAWEVRFYQVPFSVAQAEAALQEYNFREIGLVLRLTERRDGGGVELMIAMPANFIIWDDLLGRIEEALKKLDQALEISRLQRRIQEIGKEGE